MRDLTVWEATDGLLRTGAIWPGGKIGKNLLSKNERRQTNLNLL